MSVLPLDRDALLLIVAADAGALLRFVLVGSS
jgi:hypothetical protein